MAATNASRPETTTPSTTSLRLLFLSPRAHQTSISPLPSSAHRCLAASACSSSPPPVPSAERCAARRARRRSGPPPASCDDTTPERPPPLPPAPSLGRAARHAGRRCATLHQRGRGTPRPRNSVCPIPAISLAALRPRVLLQQRRPRPPPAGAGRHQASSAVTQGDASSR